jgi:hypothetical protein
MPRTDSTTSSSPARRTLLAGPSFLFARAVAALVALAALGSSGVGSAQASSPSQVARLLGGLPVEGSDAAMAVADRTFARYAERVDGWWRRYEEQIGAPMTAWALEVLAQTDGTVFYPFAGADFPTVHRLYPNATRYVLIALEPAGPMPALDRRADTEAILEVFTTMTEDFHRRGYFITAELIAQFARGPSGLGGITAVLATSAEREGYEVRSVEPLRVAEDGSDVVVHDGDRGVAATWGSVRLELTRRADGVPVRLDYLRLDLGDDNLRASEAEAALVTALCAHPVVVKAASHLLQYNSFSVIREAILTHAPTVVQDETGIDIDVLSRHFEVRLFGDFEHPNADFPQHLHASLVRAYDTGTAEPLPFRYGYWKNGRYALQYAGVRR